MTRKQLTFYVSPEWREHLKAIATSGMSAYIVQAIEEKAARDGQPFPVAAIAPHGVRNDAVKDGWKSRLYKDRYQLVATYTPNGFEVCHLHEYGKPVEDVFGILEVPHPHCEIHVIGVPSGITKQAVSYDVRFAVMEMGLEGSTTKRDS